MCWKLQKWFYICSRDYFVYANINKIIVWWLYLLQKL